MVKKQPGEREEERFVRETLSARFGVQLQKLLESDQPGAKTADFELLVDARRSGILEVKNLISTPRTPENGWAVINQPNGICKASRTDNSPARVARLIRDSLRQLRPYAEPKILAIVNDERMADVQDLSEAFNGFLEYGNDDGFGYTNVASRRIANGDIRELKWEIDLYMWLDRADAREPVFRVVTDDGHQLARQCFGCPDLGAAPVVPPPRSK